MKWLKIFKIGSLFLLFSCGAKIETLNSIVKLNAFQQGVYHSKLFEHLIIENDNKATPLHIYIEGDGRPWKSKYVISKDPTPRNPLALKLMSLDPSRSIYLGRPCYFGLYQSKNCSAKQWTSGRYSQDVIISMASVIREYNKENNIKQFALIGYSGGGVIATLLSERFEKKVPYITIASNLDVDKWTEVHDYSPLVHSVNPANVGLNKSRLGIHLVGSKDVIVPANTTRDFIRKTHSEMIAYDNFDHLCCWVENWNAILNDLVPRLTFN